MIFWRKKQKAQAEPEPEQSRKRCAKCGSILISPSEVSRLTYATIIGTHTCSVCGKIYCEPCFEYKCSCGSNKFSMVSMVKI